jgi:hypothetical protein
MATGRSTTKVNCQAGDVVRLAEDYKYGGCSLTLRVSRVRHDLSRYYDSEWVWLEGVEIRHGGSEGDQRQALVRVAALSR